MKHLALLLLVCFPSLSAAVLFSESFDHYTTLTNKWDASSVLNHASSPAIDAAKGRNGTSGGYHVAATNINNYSYTQRNLANLGTIIVGGAFYLEAAPGGEQELIGFYDGSTAQVQITVNSSGGVKMRRFAVDSTLIATASFTVPFGQYFYLEAKVVFSNTGSVTLKLNGATTSTHSSIDTTQTANNYATAVRFGSSSYDVNQGLASATRMDDLYIADTTGTYNKDFIGDVRIYAVLANAAGDSTQLALTGAATNWQAVSENPPDTDTSYVSSATVGENLFGQLFRDSAHASDNLADAADLESFYVVYRRVL